MTRTGAARRLIGIAGAWLLASGCVYYNGIYNAQAAAKAGDKRLRAGDESGAATEFELSAARAESVLARHPESKWRPRALYLAGRGFAWANQCDKAGSRLSEFLAAPGTPLVDMERAKVALAACDVRANRLATARPLLDSLIESRDLETSLQARRWAARAALAAGDRDAVQGYLAGLDAGPLQWELVQVSLAAGEYARAESLVTARAAVGDYREDATRVVRDLWGAGQWDAAERIVVGYDVARIGDANRAAMHYLLGDLQLRSGRDSMANQHLTVARSLAGRDTLMAREAAARLSMLGMSRLSALREVDSAFARQDSAVQRTSFARRTSEQLLLVRMLESQNDATGASLYLAAEVARDSLRAPFLARTLFLRVARDVAASPLAPNALYAAGLIEPDSAAVWQAQIRNQHPNSSVAAWLNGEDAGMRPDFVTTPELLRFQWSEVTRVWSDSLRKLRLARPGTAGAVPP